MPRSTPAGPRDSGALYDEADRGREAREPHQIPGRGWLDIIRRVQQRLTRDNASIVAAGLALYSLLAIFPALTAVVLLYGLFASPQQIPEQMKSFAGLLPPEGITILQRQLTTLASQHRQTLGLGLFIALGVSLWSARSGMVALMTAANVAYNEQERRGFFRRLFTSLAFTLGAVLGFILVIAFGVAVPIVLGFVHLGAATQTVVTVLRWALLWVIAALGLALTYRFAPNRHEAKWQWVSWGSAIAATLWLVGSVLFALYVRHFGASYGHTYGALSSFVVMLLWIFFSAYVVVLGAEINSEMERQTRRDTTTGPEMPLGQRHAYSADTVGEARGKKK